MVAFCPLQKKKRVKGKKNFCVAGLEGKWPSSSPRTVPPVLVWIFITVSSPPLMHREINGPDSNRPESCPHSTGKKGEIFQIFLLTPPGPTTWFVFSLSSSFSSSALSRVSRVRFLALQTYIARSSVSFPTEFLRKMKDGENNWM